MRNIPSIQMIQSILVGALLLASTSASAFDRTSDPQAPDARNNVRPPQAPDARNDVRPPQAPDAPDDVRIAADSFKHQRDNGVYIATGNVELVYGERVLIADTVTFDAKKKIAIAKGNVQILLEGGDVIFTDRAQLNQQLDQGELSRLGIVLADRSRIAARSGSIRGHKTTVHRAVYSACKPCATKRGRSMDETPLWQIKARKVIHNRKSKRMIYHHAVMELGGVPVMYLPYFSHFDSSVKREDGFLTPTLRSSSLLGQMTSTPYFKTLGPHADITIDPIITTKQGPILHLQGRARTRRGYVDFDGSVTSGDLYAPTSNAAPPAPASRKAQPKASASGNAPSAPSGGAQAAPSGDAQAVAPSGNAQSPATGNAQAVAPSGKAQAVAPSGGAQAAPSGDAQPKASGKAQPKAAAAGNNPIRTGRMRGHVKTHGQFVVNRNMRWGFNINRASDDTYLRRYNFGGARSLTSRIFAEGFQGRNYLTGELLAFQDQRINVEQKRVPTILPDISYHFSQIPNRYGAFWSWDSNINHLTREKGSKRMRFVNRLGFSLPYKTEQGHIFRLDGNVRADYYNVENAPLSLTQRPPIWTPPQDPTTLEEARRSHSTSRYFGNTSLTWKYPLLRIGKNTTSILEPISMLVLAPNVGIEKDITNEDSTDYEWEENNLFVANRRNGWDRLDGGHRVDYGLRYDIYRYANRGPKTSDRGTLQDGQISFLIGQSYRLRLQSELSTSPGNEKRLSDIVGRIAIAESSPVGLMELFYRYRFNYESQSLKVNGVSAVLTTKRFGMDVDYINIKAGATTRNAARRHEINMGTSYDFLNYWNVRSTASYDLVGEGHLLDFATKLVYLGDCVGFSFGFSKQYNRDRDYEPSANYLFSIIFKNLGSSWNTESLL